MSPVLPSFTASASEQVLYEGLVCRMEFSQMFTTNFFLVFHVRLGSGNVSGHISGHVSGYVSAN